VSSNPKGRVAENSPLNGDALQKLMYFYSKTNHH